MIRSYSVRIDVIRNNSHVLSLSPAIDPMIDCNSESEIKMSMSGVFYDDPRVSWMTDELRPYQIIDGIEHSVGIFPIGTMTKSVDENGVATVSVEAYDRSLYLKQKKTEEVLHFSAGTNYMKVIEQLMVQSGIVRYIATPTKETLSVDREDWDIGTSYLTIINTLLGEINYNNVWFNSDGIAILQPIRQPSAANIAHQYSELDEIRVLQRQNAIEADVFDAPNVFIAICDNPDLDAPLTSTATNDSMISPISVEARGRRIVKLVRVDNIASQDALDDYVKTLCFQSMMSAEVATVYTANLPGHGVYDTVAINHPDIEGVFEEVSWSLVLAPGKTMTHKLRRLIIV